MNDYLGGQTRDELEALLRRLIDQGPEGHKVDFKEALAFATAAERAEIAKDISSIANTDDENHLDDCGYVILGARRRQLVGGIAALAGDIDKVQAHINDVLKGFLAPVPTFSLVAFNDPAAGPWGVIVIPSSSRQPHLFVRDGDGVVKHEWWVRINDTKDRAGVLDYARILSKAVRREVRPLEAEVQRLALLVEQRRPAHDLATIVSAIRGEGVEGVRSQPPELDVTASVRALLVCGGNQVEDRLVAEALRVAGVMGEASDRNPWVLAGRKPEELRDTLSYLEEQTFPLAEAFATVARYDRDGLLTDAVCRAFRVIAREPQPEGAHYQNTSQFRLYPLVLCLYALAIVGVIERREDLLRRVFSLSMEREQRDGVEPIVVAFSRVRYASEVFKAAQEKEFLEPIAMRVSEVLVPRLSGLLAGSSSKDAFFVAEFVLGLAFLAVSDGLWHGKAPLAGRYLYERGAHRPIGMFLGQRPDWLESVIGKPLQSILPEFDETVDRVLQSGGFRQGFVSGAKDAYSAKAKEPK